MDNDEEIEFIPSEPDPSEAWVSVWTAKGYMAMTTGKASAYHEEQKRLFGFDELEYRIQTLERSHASLQKAHDDLVKALRSR